MSIGPTETEWRLLPGNDSYRVSSCGRVQSRRTRSERRLAIEGWRELSTKPNTTGYCVTTIITGTSKGPMLVHRLVAAAFIGPQPNGMEVCHCDGVKTNNHVSNLRYDTHSANMVDAVKHGTLHPNSSAFFASLTDEQVISIRKELSEDASYGRPTLIAIKYGVQAQTIYRIKLGKTYKHLQIAS